MSFALPLKSSPPGQPPDPFGSVLVGGVFRLIENPVPFGIPPVATGPNTMSYKNFPPPPVCITVHSTNGPGPQVIGVEKVKVAKTLNSSQFCPLSFRKERSPPPLLSAPKVKLLLKSIVGSAGSRSTPIPGLAARSASGAAAISNVTREVRKRICHPDDGITEISLFSYIGEVVRTISEVLSKL